MKKLCAAFAFISAVFPAFSAVYEFRNRSGNVDFLDVSYWNRYDGTAVNATELPSDGDSVYMTSGEGRNIEVYVGGSVSKAYKYILFKPFVSSSLRFYGIDGYTLDMPFAAPGSYNSSGFFIYNPDSEGCIYTYGNTLSNAVLSLRNADFTVAADAEKRVTASFIKGTYDFAPDGLASKDLSFDVQLGAMASFSSMTELKMPRLSVGSGSRLYLNGKTEILGGVSVSGGRLEFLGEDEKTIGDNVSVSASGVLLVDDGALVRQLSGQLGIEGTALSQLLVSNGVYDATAVDVYVGAKTDGRLTVDGGEVRVFGGNGIQVGHTGGNGTVELLRGKLTVNRIRLSRSTASDAIRALFVQKGGAFEATGDNGIQFQQSCTDDNKGIHEIRLDGGVAKLTRIFRDATVTAGEAILSGDGGKLVARKSRADFVSNITRVEFGDKGLVLDSNGCDLGISAPVVNKADESGLFIKEGEGTVSFSGGEWSVSRSIVRGGTLKMSGNYVSPSDFTLTGGAALSLSGPATTLSVGDLDLFDCALELDVGDQITVNGNLDGNYARIRWTSLPVGPQPFLIVKGGISDAAREMILSMTCENALTDGIYPKCTFSTDESGTTTVSFTTDAKTALTGETRWTGAGAWAEKANWSNGKVPDAADAAVFDGNSRGSEIAVAAGDKAGSLRITGGAYTVSGTAPLCLAGQGGETKVEIDAGDHIFNMPLALAGDTELAVSYGASLTLLGSVHYGSLVKSGFGKLTLSGGLATYGGLEMEDGMLEITSDDAIGTVSSDRLRLRAGTVRFNHPEGEEMTFNVPVVQEGYSSVTTVVYRTDTPVTLKNFCNKRGFIVKAGAETLTVDVAPGRKTCLNPDDLIGQLAGDRLAFNNDGSVSYNGGQPVRIAEGELRFTGGEGSVITNMGSIRLGVPLAAPPARACPAMFTVDGVEFDGFNSQSFIPGYYMDFATHNPTSIVRVINGGLLKVRVAQPGYACTKDKTLVVFALTNGTYRSVVATSYLTRGRLDSTPSRYTIVRYLMDNARAEFAGSVYFDGSITVDAGNNSYFGREKNLPMQLVWNNANRIYGEMFFHSGSTFACSGFEEKTGQTRLLVIAFDNARWLYDAENGDKIWPAPLTEFIRYEMRGRGVILSPAAGKTFRTEAMFEGEGGVVNAGEGTVAFAEGTCAFGGVLEVVKEGAVADLSDAGDLQSLKVAGNGTVSGVNAARLTVRHPVGTDWSSAAGLPVLHDCVVSRVDIDAGRTPESPVAGIDGAAAFPVARISGTTVFDPGAWRLTGTGIKSLGGEFTLVGDTVYVKPEYRGFQMIVR